MSSWAVWTLVIIALAMIAVPILFAWVVRESRREENEKPSPAATRQIPRKSR